jgi:hypothetical protein
MKQVGRDTKLRVSLHTRDTIFALITGVPRLLCAYRRALWMAGVRFPARAQIVSLLHSLQTGFGALEFLEFTQPIEWVPGALSLGVKRPGREANHSLPGSVRSEKSMDLYVHSPIRLHGVVFN